MTTLVATHAVITAYCVSDLRKQLDGCLFLSSDGGYEEVLRGWNKAVTQATPNVPGRTPRWWQCPHSPPLVCMGRSDEIAVREAYRENYARLAAIKRTYDPTNLFCLNQNILPSAI